MSDQSIGNIPSNETRPTIEKIVDGLRPMGDLK